MKLIALILTYIFFINAFAAAPLGVSGQSQSNLYPAVVKVPNNQATNTGAATSLLETGNKNILSNPSFEHATVTTSWTLASGTPTGDTVNEIDGLKALSISLSSQTLALTQDSTLYASQFNGVVQGLATVRVKTSVAGVRLCARQAGVTSSTLCVSHSGSGNWELLKVPFILSATSNGLSINTASNVTGTVLIDDAFVGAVDLKVDTNNISNWTSFTPTGTWNTNVTYSGRWRRVGDTAEIEYRALTSGAPNSANFALDVPSFLGVVDTSKMISDPLGFSNLGSRVDVLKSGGNRYQGYAYYDASLSRVFAYTIKTFSGTNPVYNGIEGVTNTVPITFANGDSIIVKVALPIVGWASSGSIYSTNYYATDRIGEIIFTSNATAPSGFISALGSSIGQSGSAATFTGNSYYPLYEHAWNIPGLTTTAGAPYRISSAKGASALADWQANKTITFDYATNSPFIRPKASSATVGAYTADSFASHTHGVSAYGGAGGGGVTVQANTLTTLYNLSTGATGGSETAPKHVALFAYVRFQADNQIIVGQFNGLESCTDTYQCTDTYSAKISATGVVSDENIDWINGNATIAATSQFTLTFKSGLFTVQPTCVVGMFDPNNDGAVRIFGLTASTINVYTASAPGAAGAVRGFSIICQKQGADFIGKTAKAVASDQNVRSVGSVGVDIQSVVFGGGSDCTSACTTGSCTICNKVGTKITSVTWNSTGAYRLNGIDGSKYNCSGNGYNAGIIPGLYVPQLAGSSFAQMNYYSSGSTTSNIGYGSVTCIGIP